mmetsp:Transcript_82453/g.229806  ORF Transcript_82453/g.229806 Transcript_82453/m.229806 type:complete len:403 (+) Transcript_82453:64-1272(+)
MPGSSDAAPPAAHSAAASAAAAASLFAASYSPELYQALSDDTLRVEAYRKAIAARVKGLRVLDVGTGPVALLAVLAARAGAAKVTAVEVSPAVAASARATVEREGLSDVVQVLEGFSTQLELPEVDIVIHELIGDIATEEGLPLVLADLRTRQPPLLDTAAPGWVIPRRALTWVAPVNLHLPLPISGRGKAGPPEVRLPMALPRETLLGERQVLEDCNAEASVLLQETRTLYWKASASGTLTGFVCAPRIEMDDEVVLDAWDERTHWRHVVVLLPQPALVDPGDEIRLEISMDLRSFPSDYRFAAAVRRSGALGAEARDAAAFVDIGASMIRLDLPDDPKAKRRSAVKVRPAAAAPVRKKPSAGGGAPVVKARPALAPGKRSRSEGGGVGARAVKRPARRGL